jgi:hypothetical protein
VKLPSATPTLEVIHNHVITFDEGNKHHCEIGCVLKASVGRVLTTLRTLEFAFIDLFNFAFISKDHECAFWDEVSSL